LYDLSTVSSSSSSPLHSRSHTIRFVRWIATTTALPQLESNVSGACLCSAIVKHLRFVSEWSEAGRKPVACSWDDRSGVIFSRQLVILSRKKNLNRQTKTAAAAAASSVQHYRCISTQGQVQNVAYHGLSTKMTL
jgi:hypothetical protein